MTTDSEFMSRWFASVTKPQLAQYNLRMADAFPYRNSPRWTREQIAAMREWDNSTAEARRLYQRAMGELEALGEITGDTDFLLTQFSECSQALARSRRKDSGGGMSHDDI